MMILRVFMTLMLIGSMACSSKLYLINEWAIDDIQSPNRYDEKITEVFSKMKEGGMVIFDKDNNYKMITQMGVIKGKWFFIKNDYSTLYTVNDEGDTIKNKIVLMEKDKLIVHTEDPNAPLQIKMSVKPASKK